MSLAAAIEKALGIGVEIAPGNLGQFDVLADGAVVATRKKGLRKLLGGGWPEASRVIQDLRTLG